MKNFQNRVAVITGAASGFGKAFAEEGAALGMKLVLADIQADTLNATVAELQASGASVIGLRTDVSKSEQIQGLADVAMAQFDEVHLLFNNAGVDMGGLVTFDAVGEQDFYVCSHPHTMTLVQERFDALIHQRNPGLSFANKPEVRAKLMSDLRG